MGMNRKIRWRETFSFPEIGSIEDVPFYAFITFNLLQEGLGHEILKAKFRVNFLLRSSTYMRRKEKQGEGMASAIFQ